MQLRPASDWGAFRRLTRRLAGEHGYTMSELLVVMIILGIVVTSLATVFVSASRAEVDMNLRFRAQQEARQALDQLRREGHCASALAIPAANTITFTFGAYCNTALNRGARAFLAANVTTTSTSISATVFGGAPFPAPPFTIRVNNEVMRVTAVSGATWSVTRAQPGQDGVATTAAAHSLNSLIQIGPYQVTWCTSGSGTRWALRRIPDAASVCTGGRITADYLTNGSVFAYTHYSATRRATLRASFDVDVDPANAMRIYRLQDDIVLRNTPRS